MPLILLNILVICTSLLAWLILSFAGISQFQYSRYNKKIKLIASIVVVLWVVSCYNTWYEGFYLFGKITHLSSLNCWSLTLLTPLLYIYFRFCITNVLPYLRQRILHLFLPGILAGIYICMFLFSPVHDKSIFSWNEFGFNHTTWWGLFCISCYLVMILQWAVYLPNLCRAIRIKDKNTPQIRCVKKELLYILCFYSISLVSMLTTSYVFKILYNISIILIGKYILEQTAYYRAIKNKMGSYLLSYLFANTELHTDKTIEVCETIESEQNKVTENTDTLILIPEKEEELERLLKSPEYLHNSKMTLKILARALGTNATTLSHYFNQQLGLRFAQYIANRRMDEAEILLKETNLTVTEISEKVGFQTISTFYQVFKSRHNLPPSQWRKIIND